MNHGETETQRGGGRLWSQVMRFAALGLGVAVVHSLSGQEVKSQAVGFLTLTVPPGQTRALSVPFVSDPSSQVNSVGRITAVGSNYLEVASAKWVPGAFSVPGAPYFVRLTSGVQAGRLFQILTATPNTETRLYISDDGLGLATLGIETGDAGAAYEILPGDTLASLLGSTAAEVVLQGGPDPLSSDLLLVWGGASWFNFYFNTTWGRWARDTDTPTSPTRNNFVLRPDRGVMVTRRASTQLDVAIMGRVMATPQRAFHSRTANTLTFLATMQASDTTLGALGLQSGTRTTGWRGSANSDEADIVLVWSGASWFSFYFNSTTGHWQRVGDTNPNRDAFVIRAGTPVFVQRRASGATAEDKTVNFPAPGS